MSFCNIGYQEFELKKKIWRELGGREGGQKNEDENDNEEERG